MHRWMELTTMSKQTTLYERFWKERGEWYKREKLKYEFVAGVRRAEEKAPLMEPFSVKYATTNQREALETYMRTQTDIRDFRGFSTWAKWSETTYYDILKIQSPDT